MALPKEIEDLIILARQKPDVYIDEENLAQFIKDCNIRRGKERVPGYAIIYRYLEWCDWKSVYTPRQFSIAFSKIFKKIRDKNGYVFLLNKMPFKDILDNEEIREKASKLTKKVNLHKLPEREETT